MLNSTTYNRPVYHIIDDNPDQYGRDPDEPVDFSGARAFSSNFGKRPLAKIEKKRST